MKKFILLSLILASQMAAAETLSKRESRKVIQAIIESLPSTNLNCVDSENLSFASSNLQLDFYLHRYNDAKPARVTLEKNQGNEGMFIQLGNDKTELMTSIDTDSSFKVIKGITFEVAEYSTKMVNVGSLIDPSYSEVLSRKVVKSIKCE